MERQQPTTREVPSWKKHRDIRRNTWNIHSKYIHDTIIIHWKSCLHRLFSRLYLHDRERTDAALSLTHNLYIFLVQSTCHSSFCFRDIHWIKCITDRAYLMDVRTSHGTKQDWIGRYGGERDTMNNNGIGGLFAPQQQHRGNASKKIFHGPWIWTFQLLDSSVDWIPLPKIYLWLPQKTSWRLSYPVSSLWQSLPCIPACQWHPGRLQ